MKPIAAVMVEGTLTTGYDVPIGNLGDWKPGVKEKMKKLNETHHILLVSSVVQYSWGLPLLLDRVTQDEIPFDEIWMLDGLPVSAVRYDDEALKL